MDFTRYVIGLAVLIGIPMTLSVVVSAHLFFKRRVHRTEKACSRQGQGLENALH